MNDPVSRHPGAETMAAFLEGKLAPSDVAEVAAHLSGCSECRTVTGEAAQFEQEEQQLAAKPRVLAGWRGWAAAAAIAAITASIPLLRPATAIATLIDASPREYRTVNGRLSGFPWARLQGEARGPSSESPADHELRSAAYKVLSRTTNDDAVEARRAAGVAYLLIDQNVDSLDKLVRAAGESKDAHVWNDLAAAQFTVAVREERKAVLPSALASADRAIQLDPNLAEAYFNRALIVQELGLRDAARKAWARYLELDPSSGWSNEARTRLRELGDASSEIDFKKELARAAGNRDAILALVRRFPQDARVAGEGPLLGEWADAYVANDAARAEEKLAVIRTIAEELAARKGDRLLLDIIRSIDRTPDARSVAAAYRTYLDAGASAKARDLGPAEDGFRRAAAVFHAAGNPAANIAEYYAAQCAFDRNRPAESTAALQALRARLDPSYRALSAQIDWTLTRNAIAAADWGAAARTATRALATFADLGETGNAAMMNAFQAIALERMGQFDPAWNRRVEAIGRLARDSQRVTTILHAGALSLAAADHADAAGALMDVAIQMQSNAAMRTTALTLRARLAERAGDVVAARRWLGEARTEIVQVKDAKLREARAPQIDLADAVLQRASDPHASISALDRSIASFEQPGQRLLLPDAYLQRARAYRAIGRDDAALADYDAARRAIDDQQERAGRNAVSIEFLDVAAQAIDETIELHLERGEIARAFAVADRGHAMAAAEYRAANVPDGVAVIEYAVLPHSLAIFCLTSEGLAAKRVPIERGVLGAHIESFTRKLRAREDIRADATALYRLLLAPAVPRIANARELVIVKDRQLQMLPFAALYDGSRYLIETHALRVAPSAAAIEGRAEARAALSNAVVIADPASDRAAHLPWSRREAESIASLYPGTKMIAGADATRARVSEAIASSDVVHYAGHADSNAESYGALLLAPDGNDSGLLTAADIARLHLQTRPLVVLSACGTLRGETTHVAGMPSLARAFLSAGARGVVGTLWEIDDDVALPLFRGFHEHLYAGEVPADALRAAQLEMLQTSDPRLRDPSAWSAVEVLNNL